MDKYNKNPNSKLHMKEYIRRATAALTLGAALSTGAAIETKHAQIKPTTMAVEQSHLNFAAQNRQDITQKVNSMLRQNGQKARIGIASPVGLTATITQANSAPKATVMPTIVIMINSPQKERPSFAMLDGNVSRAKFMDATFHPSNSMRYGSAQFRDVNLSLNPSTIDFPNTITGQSSIVGVVLLNGGTSSVTLTSDTFKAPGFTLSGLTVPQSIAAGKSTAFKLAFAPTATGQQTGTLSIASTAPTVTETVNGYGVKQHTVTLKWTQSVTAQVNQYNVFRGDTAGSYILITPTPLSSSLCTPQCQTTDTQIEAGNEYYYVVTAIDSQNGEESVYSAPASVAVPIP